MAAMIQIRHVPVALHRKLKSRAAATGQSLSDFLLREIQAIAAQPTPEEMVARLQSRSVVVPNVDTADLIREARDRV